MFKLLSPRVKLVSRIGWRSDRGAVIDLVSQVSLEAQGVLKSALQ